MIKPNNNLHKKADITIVGGGLVGMAAAIGLSRYPLKIVLIENQETSENSHPSYDDRTLVINRASIQFWKNTGIWESLKQKLTAINSVNVSNKGKFGSVIFDKAELNVKALAYIVEAKILGLSLKNKINCIDNIEVICPATVRAFEGKQECIKIEYTQAQISHSITCQLMLAADGIQSPIRKKLQLKTTIKSYGMSAIVCNITPELKHNNRAFERFTQTGPTALLPFINNRCGFVWTVKQELASSLLNLKDDVFLKKAQHQFGYRLGKFLKVGKRSVYPLFLVEVPQQTKSRTILIGNAAHGMSPVSAQGLNLAVRDVAHLVDVIEQALKNKKDIGSEEILNQYQQAVSFDQSKTMQYTDDLMHWFALDNPVVNSARSLGLFALDQLTGIKRDLFNRASGYRGATAKLARKQ